MKEILAFMILCAYVSFQIHMGFFHDNDAQKWYLSAQYADIMLMAIIFLRPKHWANLASLSVVMILTGTELMQEHTGDNTSLESSDYINILFGAIALLYSIYRKITRERTNLRHNKAA